MYSKFTRLSGDFSDFRMANTEYVSSNRLTREANDKRIATSKIGLPIALVLIVVFPQVWWFFLIAITILILNSGVTEIAGAAGEDRTLSMLKHLPDSYTIFNQVYVPNNKSRNGKTELDFIVIGPNGVFVIEVKNNNSKIMGQERGDWTVYKVGGRGKPYTAKMRNPISQLKSQLWALADHLESNGTKTWIEGMVFLSNKSSRFQFKGDSSVKIFHRSGIVDYILDYRPKYSPRNLDMAKSQLIALKQNS
jgi:hypothetical protein